LLPKCIYEMTPNCALQCTGRRQGKRPMSHNSSAGNVITGWPTGKSYISLLNKVSYGVTLLRLTWLHNTLGPEVVAQRARKGICRMKEQNKATYAYFHTEKLPHVSTSMNCPVCVVSRAFLPLPPFPTSSLLHGAGITQYTEQVTSRAGDPGFKSLKMNDSFLRSALTDSGVPPVYLMGTGASFPMG
jgi:hypothetical protein